MPFLASHNAAVLYAIETGNITDSTNDSTPDALPLAPTSPVLLGYTNLPQRSRGLGNGKGFAIGQQGAAYNRRGPVAPEITIEIRPGSVGALANFFPDPATGVLPSLCIYVAVKGQYTDVYRFCKPNSLAFNFGGNGAQGGELSVSANLWAIAYQRTAAITFPNTAQLRSLGTPLMWHDVRKFEITGGDGTTNSYRKALMSLSASIQYGLERKNQRQNFGDDKPLSRATYGLLEHQLSVTGEIALHERLPENLFTGAAIAQDWGDIAIRCSDAPVGSPDPKGFTLTLTDCFPSDESGQAAEAGAEIDHSIAFSAGTAVYEIED